VDGWVGGRESRVKDCLQQSNTQIFTSLCPRNRGATLSEHEKPNVACSLHYKYGLQLGPLFKYGTHMFSMSKRGCCGNNKETMQAWASPPFLMDAT
jgi:hypothetical protein